MKLIFRRGYSIIAKLLRAGRLQLSAYCLLICSLHLLSAVAEGQSPQIPLTWEPVEVQTSLLDGWADVYLIAKSHPGAQLSLAPGKIFVLKDQKLEAFSAKQLQISWTEATVADEDGLLRIHFLLPRGQVQIPLEFKPDAKGARIPLWIAIEVSE